MATSKQLARQAIRLLPVAGLLFPSSLYPCKHPALPVESFVIHLGFPYRSSLESWCAVQLYGKRLHSTHCSSETTHTPAKSKCRPPGLLLAQGPTHGSRKFHLSTARFHFLCQACDRRHVKPLNSPLGVFLFEKKVPFLGGRKLQTVVWFAVCIFLKLNERYSGWIQSNNM